MRAQEGQGLYAASEWSVFLGPPQAWAKDGTLRGLVHAHGHGGDSRACRDYTNSDLLGLSNSIGGIYPFLSIDAGGTTNWGYVPAVARMADGFTYLTGTWGAKSGKVLLWGDSMGALACLNWAKQNPTQVAGVALTRPVLDLNDIVTNNRNGFATEVHTTFGMRPDTCGITNTSATVSDPTIAAGDVGKRVAGTGIQGNTVINSVSAGVSFVMSKNATATNLSANLQIGGYLEATHGSTYNPDNYGASLNGIPIQIWNASDDTIAVPVAVTTFLGLCASASATSVGAVGHGGAVAAVDTTAFLAFLAANA